MLNFVCSNGRWILPSLELQRLSKDIAWIENLPHPTYLEERFMCRLAVKKAQQRLDAATKTHHEPLTNRATTLRRSRC